MKAREKALRISIRVAAAALALVCGILLGPLALPVTAASQPAARPNILFVLTDDQRWDTLGCAGNRIIRTPHLDTLARDGVRFQNAMVTTPICAASRASILTGLHERTHRFTFDRPPLEDRFVDASYPVQLRAAGYRTGFVGKFGVVVANGARERMFDEFVAIGRTPYMKRQSDGSVRHETDLVGDRAIQFLDECPPGQPFCLSLSFNAPHAEDRDPQQYFWPPEFDGWYDDVALSPPPTMTPEFFAALPVFLRESESRVRFRWRFDTPQKYQRMVKGYYRMISGVDAVVGRLREALTRRGFADNTIIVFTSDNGCFLGERGFADKWYGYEPSLRVPSIIFDPRLPAGQRGRVVAPVALNVDLAPTLLDYAGVAVPASMQGHSLVALMRGAPIPDWRGDFFFEHLFARANIPKSEGVRTERWTYVRWFEQQPVVEELYDHASDFDETCNLAADPQHATVLAQLRRRTDEFRQRYEDARGSVSPGSEPAGTTGKE